jgi:ubiquinone/menaquinone biosynthesis C-methylase UbiE
MAKEKDNKKFWSRYAKFYDMEVLRFSGAAYNEMYRLMGNALTKEMNALEIATGTGLISINTARYVHSIHATDFSPKMIDAAKKKDAPPNVFFSVEDGTALSFADRTFDAVIISNALHIMPNPQKVLAEVKRVLRPSGLLIAPTFSHGHLRDSTWKLNAAILKLIGFETYSKWTPDEYAAFIGQNGFAVKNWRVLKAAFPLVYLEAVEATGKPQS